ncbi:MAG: M20 family metallo-hydrolase [Bacteroidota bacterium]
MKDRSQLVDWLSQLIATPSLSREEDNTARLIEEWLREAGLSPQRHGNNVWASSPHNQDGRPTVLLNSHHDTVKPNAGYTRDPFVPEVVEGKLYGLGSNDAGGCLISLLATFLHYVAEPLAEVNLVFAASAEEEISGKGGMEALFPHLPAIDVAVVGEPTLGQLAVAEKGLMVIDALAPGRSGHAAREEGDNALYRALDDIAWLRQFEFPKQSEWLGKVKATATIIQSGTQHNVVPAECSFTLDVRTTDAYTNQEVLAILQEHMQSTLTPRSTRLQPSGIPDSHALVQAGLAMEREAYGSPTLSDQALIPVPSLKMGPGDSARSHTADEFIWVDELEAGHRDYVQLLAGFAERMAKP